MPKSVLCRLGRLIDLSSNIGGGISGLIILLMAFSVFFEIVLRGLFAMPTKWVLEYSGYAVIAAAFFGAAYTAKSHRHISVDLLTSRMSDRTRTALEFVTHLWSVAFCIILVYAATKLVVFSMQNSVVSVTLLHTPMWIPEGTIAIGAILLTLQLVKLTVSKGALMTKIEAGAEPRKTFLTPVDKPSIMLPIAVGVLALGTALFYLGGPLRVVGLIVLLLGMLGTGTPVFLALGIVGSGGLLSLIGGLSSQDSIAAFAYSSLNSFTLAAIPLFIMGAGLFALSGITDKLYDICSAWLSFLRGNLAMATIASCAIFAAISGSSVATAATIGLIAIPAMIGRQYDKELACGSVAGGGTLGILIPPSLMFIIYGVITDTSVGQLFIGGVFPGMLIALLFMAYIFIKCRKDIRYKPAATVTWKERFATIKNGLAILFAPLLVLGGIYSGIFTPTEAAAVVVLYGITLCLITRRFKWQNLLAVLRDCTNSSTMILMIIVGAIILGGVITMLQVPQAFTQWAVSSALPPWGIIVMIMLLLIILGMFLECVSIELITIPILFPAVMALGYDPIWFGVLYCINMELALVTPPVGLNLYVVQGISGHKLETVIKGAFPFTIMLIIGLVTIGLFEPLSTWLPSRMIR